MPILKSDIAAPVLPEQQTVMVEELGGEVIVRPLFLAEKIAMSQRHIDGRTKDFGHIAALLAYAVVDDNGEQLFTVEQWETWGSAHVAATMKLWDVAFGMSGLDREAAEKKSEAQNSDSQ
jgi:O-succinylbenzoate synthase